MYCRQCGQPVGAQAHCSHCGAPTGIVATVIPPAGSRLVAHLHTLGVLWIVFAVYLLLRWLLVLPFLHMAFGRGWWMSGSGMAGSDVWMFQQMHPGAWLIHVITVVVFVRAILSLAVGFALMTRQPWGRVFAIVMAVLTLLKLFLGSVLAIYTLWVLLERNGDQTYARLSAERQPYPPGPPSSPS